MNRPTTAFRSLLLALLMVLPSLATATAGTTPQQTSPQPLPQGRYDLLIIAPKEFHNELVPLVRHKDRIGIRTVLVDTATVYKEMFWQGRDDAEKVKYFIKAAVENWGVHYVLLVGGRRNQGHTERWWVPVRYSHLDRPYIENPTLAYPGTQIPLRPLLRGHLHRERQLLQLGRQRQRHLRRMGTRTSSRRPPRPHPRRQPRPTPLPQHPRGTHRR